MNKKTIFGFSGQGSQYVGMARELYEQEPLFSHWMSTLDKLVMEATGESVVEKLYQTAATKGAAQTPFDRTRHTHPAIFMVEFSLAMLLMEKGIRPDAVVGVSLGEFAAAAVAEVMSPELALECVLQQAHLFEEHCALGGMLAVLAHPSYYEAKPEIHAYCELAGVNTEKHFVVSGRLENLHRVEAYLKSQELDYHKIPVSHGFHSRAMDPAAKYYKKFLKMKHFHKPKLPVISVSSGSWLEERLWEAENRSELLAQYFWNVARGPMFFPKAMEELEATGPHLYLDLGPYGTLANFIKGNLTKDSASEVYAILSPLSSDKKNLERVISIYQEQALSTIQKEAAVSLQPDVKRAEKENETMLAYIFPGQGAQKKGMGAGLFEEFRALTDTANRILGYDIRELCLEDAQGDLSKTQFTQPALYVVNALHYYKKLKETGRRPDFVAGHSLGEYNALLAAEVFDFETGLRLVQKRGELMSRQTGGGMAAVVGLTEEKIRGLLQQNKLLHIEIANFNTPSQMVLSGLAEEIQAAKPIFEAAGATLYVILQVSGAFHSKYMREPGKQFAAFLEGFSFHQPVIPVLSNVTAKPYEAGRTYERLTQQIDHSVRWCDSMRWLLGRGDVQIEQLGPGNVLTGMMRNIKKEAQAIATDSLSAAGDPDGIKVCEALAGRSFTNLQEVLQTVASDPQGRGIVFVLGKDKEASITYRDLLHISQRLLHKLQAKGIQGGDEVIIHVEDPRAFVISFWACLLGGIIAVPISTAGSDENRRKMLNVWQILNNPFVISCPRMLDNLELYANKNELAPVFDSLKAKSYTEDPLSLMDDLEEDTADGSRLPEIQASDIAFIQFSSGSTGEPKGVIISHENVMTNVMDMANAIAMRDQDVVLNWMPLTHDMGLIGNHLTPLVCNLQQIIMPTTLFIKSPRLWLSKASEHSASLLSSPNFGLHYYLQNFKEAEAQSLNLSQVRLIFNGAEPISEKLCVEFLDKMAPYGLSKTSMFTVYGLAEATLAVAFPKPSQRFGSVCVDKRHLAFGEVVQAMGRDEDSSIVFVEEGYPVGHCQIRIADASGNPLLEGHIGDILIKGKNVTRGYYNNPRATQAVMTEDGWLKTGDLGFMYQGKLVVTGRAKDIIFINGQNVYPFDIERLIEAYDPNLSGKVVACGVFDANAHKERLIIAVLFKKKEEAFSETAREIQNLIVSKTGLEVYDIVPVTKIPKTTSGKVQRYKVAQEYVENGLEKRRLQKVASPQTVPLTQMLVPGRAAVTDMVVTIVAEVLGLEAAGILPQEEISTLGFDSLSFVRFANRINETFQLELTPSIFFEYRNLESFCTFLSEKLEPGQEKPEIASLQASLTQKQEKQKPWKEKRYAYADEPIAIIGVHGKFPMSDSVDSLWDNLMEGKRMITEIPADRWDWKSYYGDPLLDTNKTDVIWGGFIRDVDKFDARFFSISPKEAELMDPQQRVALQSVWSVIADAGYKAADLSGTKTGVFYGVSTSDYHALLMENGVESSPQLATGLTHSVLPNRISYLLNLLGPSEPVDTACSSSLVAIHKAVQSIRNGECSMAIAGGINLILGPSLYLSFSKAGMLSKDGECRAFDAGANGYVRGEGVGTIFLKPLSQAIADKDYIYSVIKGSAINHGGHTNTLTTPNPNAQADVIIRAWENSGIHPDHISYLEAHGTGTPLGDPIEISGMKKAVEALYQKHNSIRKKTAFCGIGSIKTHIGHLEAAAGIAGVIKVLLAMKHKTLPANRNFRQLNPYIDLNGSPFYILDEKRSWKGAGEEVKAPLCAGISSFGFGGVNAHLVLVEHDNAHLKSADKQKHLFAQEGEKEQLFVLSAKDKPALKRYVGRILDFIHESKAKKRELNLSAVAYTLQVARDAMEERMAVLSANVGDLIEKLQLFCTEKIDDLEAFYTGTVKKEKSKVHGHPEGAEGRRQSEEMIHQQPLDAIAKLWVSGAEIDWKRLYPHEKPLRISMPAYPFAMERYWAIKDKGPGNNKKMYCMLHKEWKASMAYVSDPQALARKWLILLNPETLTLGKALAEKINGECVLYTQEHLSMLMEALEEKDGFSGQEGFEGFEGLLDLSDLHERPLNKVEENFEKIQLIQKLLLQRRNQTCAMLHFTRGLQAFENSKVSLAGATVAGFVKMLGAEYTKVTAKTVDLDLPLSNTSMILGLILAELESQGEEAEVCYRKGMRFIPFMDGEVSPELSLYEETGPHRLEDLLAADKVIVITGGTRGIGAQVAKHLVARGLRKLVILGHVPIPHRRHWESLRDSTATDGATKEKIKGIMDLEAQGARVEIYSGSLLNQEALSNFFGRIRTTLGEISGVIHCSGLAIHEHPAFIHKEISEIRRVFEPKVRGLKVLHQVLEQDPLEFFVLFSSVSALMPRLAVGVSDYAAANAFMDYYAAYQHLLGNKYFKSVQWANWAQVGMGEVESPAYIQSGLLAHGVAEGMAMLEGVLLHAGGPCIMVGSAQKDRFEPESMLRSKAANQMLAIQSFEAAAQKEQPGSTEENAAKALKASASKQPIHADAVRYFNRLLKELFSIELKISVDKLDDETVFGEYGLDSILIATLLRKVELKLGEKLQPAMFLEHPSFGSLSDYLATHYAAHTLQTPTEERDTVAQDSSAFVHFVTQGETGVTPTMPEQDPIYSAKPEPKAVKASPAYAGHSLKSHSKIAVIGLSCNFPGAKNKEEFWKNLSQGVCSISEIPKSRWDFRRYYAPQYEKGKIISKWGGFIPDIELFDPAFFNFTEEEALHTDPLVRQMMEASVRTIEDAGYLRNEISNRKVGVFVGSRVSDYADRIHTPIKTSIIGVGQNFIAAHISHFYNLLGPSLVVDTACSSSLVSIHLACQSLMLGECEMALAGGVDILLNEKPYLLLTEARALSPDGKCHTFDEKANGFVPGEGCGAVLLKPLEAAIADGDRIYAVIDASAVNNDGRTMGVTTPNPKAQSSVIRAAMDWGHIDPKTLSYIEAHGTGTMIGDPIELKALTEVFGAATAETQFCGVGSVKSNVGHLLSAAGMAGFIKVVLSLWHKKLPPTLHCEHPNPRFEFAASPFYIQRELTPWKPKEGIRRAGVSSFGFGGTNAHLVLSEAGVCLDESYVQTREPLAPQAFVKKRYWIEAEKTDTVERWEQKPKSEVLWSRSSAGGVPELIVTSDKDLFADLRTVKEKRHGNS